MFIVEGEKDVNNLVALGAVATCNPMGAMKWRELYNAHLAGRRIVIIGDNDQPGHAHAQQVASSVIGTVASVKVLELPGLPPGGDVTNWIEAGGNLEQLLTMVDAASEWVPPDLTQVREGKPTVILKGRIRDKVQALIDGITESNDPPHTFQRGREIVRIVQSSSLHGARTVRMYIEPFKLPTMRVHLCQWLDVYIARAGEDGEEKLTPRDPTKDEAEYLLSLSSWPFPDLRAILRAPTYTLDGTLVKDEGYNALASVFIDTGGYPTPAVSKDPSVEEVARARSLIVDDLLHDFPFTEQASRAHAVALGLLPFVRLMIDGVTPLHLISAPVMGTGKSMLAIIMAIIATGAYPALMGEGRDNEEWRKRITSTLQDSPAYIQIDNIKRRMDSSNLMAVLTTEEWTDRLLGHTKNVCLPNLAVWTATGNNPVMSTEFGRRVIWIHMDPKTEKPWERENFKHPKLLEWVKENRHALMWAFLTLIQNWIAQGSPPFVSDKMGSFEAWVNTIGGILETSGIPGFLANRNAMLERTDTDATEWKEFINRWLAKFAHSPAGASDLVKIAIENELLDSVFRNASMERQLSQRLVHALKKKLDVVIDGYKITKADWDSHKCSNRYRLVCVENFEFQEQMASAPTSGSDSDRFRNLKEADVEAFLDSLQEAQEAKPALEPPAEMGWNPADHIPGGSAPVSASGIRATTSKTRKQSRSRVAEGKPEPNPDGTLFPTDFRKPSKQHYED